MKTVLVTGGTSTLGIAICKRFLKEGFTVYCAFSSSAEKAQHMRDESGNSLIPMHLDVLDKDSITGAIASLARLDVLVNNSGVFTVSSIAELEEPDWDKVFDVNVKGMMRTTKACIDLLEASNGCIVNIASINAFHPGFGKTVGYDASKGAVVSFTQSLASELAPHIRVNAVAPGLIAAEYLDIQNPIRITYEKRALLGRLVESDEVAEAVWFLSSSGAVTAQVVTVDCGYLMG